VVTHENFSEYVNLTVKKQLETNLLPMIAHVKTAFEAVVPAQSRGNVSPMELKCVQSLVFVICSLLLLFNSNVAVPLFAYFREIVEGRKAIDVAQWKRWYDGSCLLRSTHASADTLFSLLNCLFRRSSYDASDYVVNWFWEHLEECSPAERKAIWSWTTGIKEMPSTASKM
jgi:hypothetical protein